MHSPRVRSSLSHPISRAASAMKRYDSIRYTGRSYLVFSRHGRAIRIVFGSSSVASLLRWRGTVRRSTKTATATAVALSSAVCGLLIVRTTIRVIGTAAASTVAGGIRLEAFSAVGYFRRHHSSVFAVAVVAAAAAAAAKHYRCLV